MLVRKGMKLKIAKVQQVAELAVESLLNVSKTGMMEKEVRDKFWHVKPIAMNPERYLYLQSMAVSGGEKHGPNNNGDYFTWEELLARYRTFIGAAVNVDHNNNKPELAIGMIIDAIPNMDEEWIEVILAIDKEKAESLYPGLVDQILTGEVTDTSMGCLVEWAICSACLAEANGDIDSLSRGQGIAYDESEYCIHVREFDDWEDEEPKIRNPHFCKGQEFQGEIVYEDNRGVTFFEDSIIRTEGADEKALILARLASKKSTNRQTVKSPLDEYIVHRLADSSKLAAYQSLTNNKGETQMGNTIKKAGNESAPAVDQLDKTSTSTVDADQKQGTVKDSELAAQAKQTSGSESMRGDNLATQVDKGDYLLANLKHMREAAKNDPKFIASMLGLKLASEDEDEEEVEAEGPEGGKPPVDDEAKIGMEPKSVADGEDEADEVDVKKAEAKKVKKGKEIALSGKQGAPSGLGKVKAALAALFDGIKEAALGNQDDISWKGDQEDYGAGSEKDKAFKSQSDSSASESVANITKEDANGQATPAERQKLQQLIRKEAFFKSRGRVLTAADKEEKEELEAKVGSADEPVKTQEDDKDKKEAATKRRAENEDKKVDHIVGEMAKGKGYEEASRLADEKFDDDSNSKQDGQAVRDESKLGSRKRSAMDNANETTDQRMNEGTEETKKSPASIVTSDRGNDLQDKELEKEKAGSTTEKPEVEGKISASKKVTVTEKKTVTEDDDAEVEADETMTTPETAIPTVGMNIVKAIDDRTADLEDKKEEEEKTAQLLASVRMADTSKRSVKTAMKLRVRIAKLDSYAERIEKVVGKFAELKDSANKAAAAKVINQLFKEAKSALTADADEDEDDDKETAEAKLQAVAMLKLAKENSRLQRVAEVNEKALKRQAKSQFITKLANIARDRGIDEGSIDKSIERWASLSEAELNGVMIAYQTMPKVAAKPVQSKLRSAEAGVERAQSGRLRGPEHAVLASSRNQMRDPLSEIDGIFEDSWGDDSKSPGNSF